MNIQATRTDDPILPELLRSRLEAIGQEAGAAVVQTAISPIVTESKDYSVTILDADGSIVSASGLIDLHYGAVMHAVRSHYRRPRRYHRRGRRVHRQRSPFGRRPAPAGRGDPAPGVRRRRARRLGGARRAHDGHGRHGPRLVGGRGDRMLPGSAAAAADPADRARRRMRRCLEHHPHQPAQQRPHRDGHAQPGGRRRGGRGEAGRADRRDGPCPVPRGQRGAGRRLPAGAARADIA